MGKYAFRKCESLKEIVIPDSVEDIGLFCFSECESLKRLVISKSLDRLENDAINNCYNIKEIVIRSNNTEVDTGIKRRFNVKYEVI